MIDISVFRFHGAHTSCQLRDLIWNWLVKHDPVSFAPKGRGDAELMGAFHLLCHEAKAASWTVSCFLTCETCTFKQPFFKISQLVEYLFTDNEKAGGDISLGLEFALRPKCIEACPTCESKRVTLTEHEYIPSDFIIMQLGLHTDHKNRRIKTPQGCTVLLFSMRPILVTIWNKMSPHLSLIRYTKL